MKKIIILLMFMSPMVFAGDPNLDTSTNIVTFPRVTVDNNTVFTDVQLLLSPDGTWEVKAAVPEVEPEETLNLNGNWDGRAVSSKFKGCTGDLSGSLVQNGNNLIGTGSVFGACINGGSGEVNGTIDGNNITFGLAFNDQTSISFTGVVSDDQTTLSGTYNWPDVNDKGTWSLSLK